MLVKSIIREIQLLPLNERFMVVEQTLKSIKKEEFKNIKEEKDLKKNDDKFSDLSSVNTNNFSLAKEWLSDEDKRWDNLL